ncbi:MAG TPA: hypothetical protein VN253_26080 [Kofleriaceae bacterium]|nr:hypothetical protein [Kofleriaceae bacterium]
MKRRALIVAVVVTGCGDDLEGFVAPTTPPADAYVVDQPAADLAEICGAQPVTLDDWEDCYQRRYCENLVGCSSLNSYRDVQECAARNDDVASGRLSAERRARRRAVEHGRASIDVAAFTQCLVDLDRAHCNTARSSVACATRFVGTVGDGGACSTDFECVSPGATCAADCADACCLGTCRPRFKQGEACDLADSCEPGLVCHGTCLSGDIGAPCVNLRDCDQVAWCNAGTCAADLTPGAACTSLSQCGGETTCIGLSIVDPTPGQCLSISRPGDRCDFACYGNLYCDPSGTCRELPVLGQSCSSFVPCRGVDTFCSNGVCVDRGDNGATCSGTKPCRPGLFCTDELGDPTPTCAARRVVGEACAAPGHCSSHLCSGSTGQPGICLPWSDTCP